MNTYCQMCLHVIGLKGDFCEKCKKTGEETFKGVR